MLNGMGYVFPPMAVATLIGLAIWFLTSSPIATAVLVVASFAIGVRYMSKKF